MVDILLVLWRRLLRAVRDMTRSNHPTVVLLIGMSFVSFILQLIFMDQIRQWCFEPPLVRDAWRGMPGSVLQMLSQTLKMIPPLFLHSGPSHLLMNMLMLWAFGCLVADHVGRFWTIILYVICGVAGNMLHVVLEPRIGAIGASGSISGLEGVYFALAFRWRLKWPNVFPLAHPIPPPQLAIFAAIGIGYDLYAVASSLGGNVAYGAHIGGFLAGLLFAAVITQLYPSERAWRTSKMAF